VSGGVGLFSASARFEFRSDCKVQNESICALLVGQRTTGYEQINEPVYTDLAANAITTGQPFQGRYGNAFIRGLTKGGRFYGFIRIDIHKEEVRQQISGGVSGSYGTFLSAKVQTDLNNRQDRGEIDIVVNVKTEGGEAIPDVSTVDDMRTAYSKWRDSVDNKPDTYSVTVEGYDIVAGANPPNLEDIANQQEIIIRCAKLRAQTTDRLNLLDYILAHMADFEFAPSLDLNGVNALRTGVALDLDVIHEAASFALDNPKEAVEPETYAKTVRKPQIPDYKLTILPPDMPARRAGAPILVPDCVGLNTEEALKNLADLGLTAHLDYDLKTGKKENNVLEQDPAAGVPVQRGATITLKVPLVLPKVGVPFNHQPPHGHIHL
jgi:hypothetical protein